MSNPTTPFPRFATASSAISDQRSACRIAVTSCPTRMVRPSAAASATPCSMPDCTASTVSWRVRPRWRCCSGAQRCSAYTTPSRARSSTASRATRARASRVCMTAIVWSNVSR
ncbi:Uncharacterised protein [Mycobacteroides abscessus]|nr:Uncharacterised protein [Mycobacteroides abscessus]